jgi:hypothetical protein
MIYYPVHDNTLTDPILSRVKKSKAPFLCSTASRLLSALTTQKSGRQNRKEYVSILLQIGTHLSTFCYELPWKQQRANTELVPLTASKQHNALVSRRYRVQTGSGANPASYPMGTRSSFLGSKAAGAWS